jgi:hypothetical protein
MAAVGAGGSNRVERRTAALLAVTGVFAGLLVIAGPAEPAAAVTVAATPYLVSRSATGVPANQDAFGDALSGDGRYFLVRSKASNLVAGDAGGHSDLFVKDRLAGTIERVSVSSAEAEADADSGRGTISDDGRYVAFTSAAKNLSGDTKAVADAFVRDRKLGTTTKASVPNDGIEPSTPVRDAAISGNGRYVAFTSSAANYVANDTNAKIDVFVRDLVAGTTERASVSFLEGQASADSEHPSISDDGRYVAFDSAADLAGGQPGVRDIYVRDRLAPSSGTTMLASTNTAEQAADGNSSYPVISGAGRYVAFDSDALNLVAGDTNVASDVFRRDLQDGVTTRASLHDNDSQIAGNTLANIADDGNRILFTSFAVATAATDVDQDEDVFIRTISTASTQRISSSSSVPDPTDDMWGQAFSDDGSIAGIDQSDYQPFATDHPDATDQAYLWERWNLGPLISPDAFATQQYQDFLGRAPTPTELSSWRTRFASGRVSPPSLIATLAADPTFTASKAPVTRLYWAFFLRKPDPGGLTYWINRSKAGVTLAAIAQKFAQSSEFNTRYGSVGNQQFVQLVYQNVFERQPDAGGLSFWTKQLDTKAKTRGEVITNFSESSEGVRRLAPQVTIVLISMGMLRAAPSSTFWDKAFAAFASGEKEAAWLAQDTLVSPGYAGRFP